MLKTNANTYRRKPHKAKNDYLPFRSNHASSSPSAVGDHAGGPALPLLIRHPPGDRLQGARGARARGDQPVLVARQLLPPRQGRQDGQADQEARQPQDHARQDDQVHHDVRP